MNFPVWQVPMGGGTLIALISIFHVFVSHFAVGGGLFLVTTETLARRRGDGELLGWLKRHSKFFALLTLVAGAVTGVGIWFTIGLVHPTATSALIHTFVWAWAIEWVFFVVEIASALLYVATWDRTDARTHTAIGWVYFVCAFMSLVVINGILSFMFTPGDWLSTHSMLDGFLNPTYLPSLLVRTLAAVAFAGLFVFATAWRAAPGLRVRLARIGALWALPATAVGPLAALYYFRVAGQPAWDAVGGVLPMAASGLRITIIAAVGYTAVLGAVALFARRRPGIVGWPAAAALLVLGLSSIGGSEFVRENVRKPYVIGNSATGGYMWVNGVRPEQLEATRAHGVLASAKWVPPEVREAKPGDPRRGEQVFVAACSGCHTVKGHNGIRRFVDNRPVAALEQAVLTLEQRRGRMPPFPGTPEEAHALALYLAGLDGTVEPQPLAPEGAVAAAGGDGKQLLEKHCLSCHELKGDPDSPGILERVKGWNEQRALDALADMKKLNRAMPPFRGTDDERRALAAYLSQLGRGTADATDGQ